MNATKRPTLLVLDDDSSLAETIASLATQVGFDSVVTTIATDFKRELDAREPDVIVLDLQMPGMDGVEVLRYLSQRRCRSQVLLVSGIDIRTLRSAAQYGEMSKLPMLGYLQKPFSPEEFVARLSSANNERVGFTSEDLEEAVDRGELTVYFQPTVRFFADQSWVVDSVEALLRWNHPSRGCITPGSFIHLAAEPTLMRKITDLVLLESIQHIRNCDIRGLDLGLRVNVPTGLMNDLSVPDHIQRLLTEYELEPERLTLEISETASLTISPEMIDILTRFRVQGVGLALDDFGVGYSSLTLLARLPFNEMKIDTDLGRHIRESAEARIMIAALIDLAHNLNLTAIVEGVEDRESADIVAEMGGDRAQGYFISSPVPAGEIDEALGSHGSRRVTDEPSDGALGGMQA
jgi:EAL domain-containing protein (putative c-di-GMP-specific phosphodiesterase class I)/ActR/RegA family two-component response regulator